ncbi:hypothetical protein [Gymnodinialimonas ulvae]|uniref:hypothetical protein n=1 Tax=Gymnodinialimonas ulvae TaxID=3126504 RepID=UPI0030B79B6B
MTERSSTEQTAQIIAFAAHIGRRDTRSPEAIAQRRNWLDASGNPTQDGQHLLEALGDQDATRTVFRGNF